ncbi:26S proteasome non-ATPase regulatory subunit 4 [Branchiostoma belcheri]|nr:26S proteasome non-ATPase regulatory subunit 4 [Branchiostoma belcheri]
MRNGDFIPTRIQALVDAVNMVCHSKSRSNPENNVGLMTMAGRCEVLVTLTSDVGKILTKMHAVQPKGNIHLMTGIRVAHLALKHRQGKNHKMRIVVFIGSPIETDDKDLIKQAKRLKKEKVSVDIISFGEEEVNNDKLTSFINTLNGKEGTSSHLVTVPPGPSLSDALLSSPVIAGEGGAPMGALGSEGNFDFGVDANADPELALALRVSMEEQRARQEEEARKATSESATETGVTPASTVTEADSEEAMLERALAMSMERGEMADDTPMPTVDFDNMTEEEQIAYAMQMSLQSVQTPELSNLANPPSEAETDTPVAMETESASAQSVLENLPGVDPNSEAIRTAVDSLRQQAKDDDKKDDKDKKGKK